MISSMGRRALLRAAGLGAAATTLAGCREHAVAPGSAAATRGSAGPTGTPTPPVTPTGHPATPTAAPTSPTGAARPPDWAALARSLRGRLVRPSDAGYDTARRLYNTRFDQIRPAAVARCANDADVRECVGFARRYRIPLALRAGGHSYAGWSTGSGLVLDVGDLDTVRIGDGRATIGAGTRLVDVYAAVARAGVGVPAGSCPTVGVTGLTLGGGIGVLTRAWGLTCDNLLAAQVVTADGRLLDCDAGRHADLFWALRGGGGGNFGVVTSLTLRTRPAPRMALEFLSWPWSRAAAVVRAWQAWLPGLPDAVWSNLHLLTTPSGAPRLTLNAFSVGSATQVAGLVDDLVSRVGSAPSSRSAQTRSYSEAMLQFAGCADLTVPQCHLPSQNSGGRLARETYAAKSHVYPAALPDAGIATLLAGVERLGRLANAGSGGVLLDALGGAVGRIAPAATAFPHRRALATAQYIVNWSATDRAAIGAGSLAWLRGYHDSMRRYAGGAYVNYIDPDLRDWAQQYYGANYPRLRRVKSAYDPDQVFTFPQAVRPG